MGLFNIFSTTPEKQLEEWRNVLVEALPKVLEGDDAFWLSEDDEDVIIKKGSAHVFVSFLLDEDGDGYVQINAPLVRLPKENLLPFYRRLLDLNGMFLASGAFATEGNLIVLRHVLPIKGVDEEGFGLAVFALCNQADEVDDLLVNEFAAPRFTPNG
jgi:hypothetical protein